MSQSTLSIDKIEKFQQKKQPYPSTFCPQFVGNINIYQDYILLSHEGRDFGFQIGTQFIEGFKKLFLMMDGTKNLSELQETLTLDNPEVLYTLVHNLDEQGFINDVTPVSLNLGIYTLLELENFTQELFNKTFDKNIFWQSNINVLYGFVIENYHLLSRIDYFMSPVLNFQASAKIRHLVNELYQQNYGQDKLLLKALNSVGISSKNLEDTIPLPETMTICNGLSYWASFEPYFFLSTLDIVIKQTQKSFESYLKACEQMQIDPNFIALIQQLSNTQLKQALESINHRIFLEIPHIDSKRFKGQIYLLTEMYSSFYKAIANYYSSTNQLLRLVSSI